MDFSAISSVKSYIKTLEMQQKWQKKKEKNDFTPQSQIERWIDDQRANNAQGIPGTPHQKNEKMSQNIYTKIANGKKLTYEEEEYLRQNDPVTYQRLKAAQAELDTYEKRLRQCKTKEDVDRLQMEYTNASLSRIGSVKNNPDIPENMEYQILMVEKQKMEAIARITVKFVQSGAYASLPTDQEKLEAEQTMQDAKNEELRPDESLDQENEALKPAENTEVSANQTPASSKETVNSDDTEKKDLTIEEAQNSPEMQKLKRARARAAYAKTQSLDDEDFSVGGSLDLSI